MNLNYASFNVLVIRNAALVIIDDVISSVNSHACKMQKVFQYYAYIAVYLIVNFQTYG